MPPHLQRGFQNSLRMLYPYSFPSLKAGQPNVEPAAIYIAVISSGVSYAAGSYFVGFLPR
ncbi:hypothetical protein KP13_04854 [Klebsiella pneumoniae subsp. pneumoniae Kp13]|nr:hypothetical protein KP13_04854 [Klebsiella pneumoniae subsp. pneumoniae Kp13]